MTDEQDCPSHVITVPPGTHIWIVPVIVDGQEMEQFVFGEGARNDIAVARNETDVLSLFGAWSDLTWDDAVDALDRIRHESIPTPPLELPDDSCEPRLNRQARDITPLDQS